jgi:hypothetical protein
VLSAENGSTLSPAYSRADCPISPCSLNRWHAWVKAFCVTVVPERWFSRCKLSMIEAAITMHFRQFFCR